MAAQVSGRCGRTFLTQAVTIHGTGPFAKCIHVSCMADAGGMRDGDDQRRTDEQSSVMQMRHSSRRDVHGVASQ